MRFTFFALLALCATFVCAQLTADENERGTLAVINAERAKAGLRPVAFNQQLFTAARLYAEDLVRENRFSHFGSDGSAPWDRTTVAGYPNPSVGEILVKGTTTPEQSVDAWMHSPGHRGIILTPEFNEAAVGKAGSIWCGVFGMGRGDVPTQPIRPTQALRTTPVPTTEAPMTEEPETVPPVEERTEEPTTVMPEDDDDDDDDVSETIDENTEEPTTAPPPTLPPMEEEDDSEEEEEEEEEEEDEEEEDDEEEEEPQTPKPKPSRKKPRKTRKPRKATRRRTRAVKRNNLRRSSRK